MGGFAPLDDATVVESQVQLALYVCQGRLGVFPVPEHGRTVFDFLCLPGVSVPLYPDIQEVLDFLVVSLAQGVEGGVIIVFPCAGDQFLEGFLTVFGEAEFLHEPDLAGGEAGPGKNDSESEGGDIANIHGFKTPFHGKGFQWSLRGWFGLAYGGPVSVVQDEDREVPGVV